MGIGQAKLLGGTSAYLVGRIRDAAGLMLTAAAVESILRRVVEPKSGMSFGDDPTSLVVADSIFDAEETWSRFEAADSDPDGWCNFRDRISADLLPDAAGKYVVTYRVTTTSGEVIGLKYLVDVEPSGF